jgi:formylglycine-generating enzyme required for sulfatase activity
MKPKQEFVTIPAGEVEIEGKLVRVESFKISNLCVTAGEFFPWKTWRSDKTQDLPPLKPNRPVTKVSWFEARDFAKARGCRLPSEAEWQWAAQGGELKQTWAGTSIEEELDKFAWFNEFNRKNPHRVGKKLPNAFGLYDMSGNVWEWCNDKVDSYRVLRGGDWYSYKQDCCSTTSGNASPDDGYEDVGFRLVSLY